MNILWLVNIVLPEAGKALNINYSVFGGWLTGALNGIRHHVEPITVAAISWDVEEIVECDVDHVHYVVFPYVERDALELLFSEYLNTHSFDVIHIYGTEMMHSAAMMSVAPASKTVINIQGLCSVITQHYLEGIPFKNVYDTITKKLLRKLTHRIEVPAVNGYFDFCELGERETETLKKAVHVIGRTNWDRACVTQINPQIKYHHVNEILRDGFYTQRAWSPENCQRHSIFLSQAGYPIKGLHYFVQALKIIRPFYPDVKVNIGGRCDLRENSGLRHKRDCWFGGYFGSINAYLTENHLHDCINVLGIKNENEMVDLYLQSNVFVCPSLIENSPNSVGEAMILGTPVVASYVGGIPDMIDNGKEGLLYQTSAPYMLADCIMRIFADDDLAMTLSKNAIERAHSTHDKENNTKDLLGVYEEIIKGAKRV